MPPRSVAGHCPKLTAFDVESQLNLARSTSEVNVTLQAPESNFSGTRNDNLPAQESYPLYENVPAHDKMIAMDAKCTRNLGSVYPLYYGIHYQNQGSQIPCTVNSTTPIFVGKPVGTSFSESAEIGAWQKMVSCPSSNIVSNTVRQPACGNNCNIPLVSECDLSLRLGQFSDPCMSAERNLYREAEDVGSSSYREANKLTSKEFCFFPGKAVDDPSDSCLRNWLSGPEHLSLEGSTRMPNIAFGDKLEDVQCRWQQGHSSNWQQGHSSNYHIGRIRGPGL